MRSRVNGFLLLAFVLSGYAAAQPSAAAPPTYSKEVSRIIQQKCQMCHRPNDIAPFALMNYDDASSHASEIRGAVANRIMPPWKPVPGHGTFKNSLWLSDGDLQTILDWVDAGAPAGDPNDLPPDLVYAAEWRLGYPDQVISMPVPYTPVGLDGGPDRYRCFVLPSMVDQDRWVRAVDIVPGVRQIVHHVVLYLTDDPEQIALAQQLDQADSDPGYDCWGGPLITPGAGPGLLKEAGGFLGAWIPGTSVIQLPPDIGILVPKGVYIVMQVHYNLENVDSALPDQSRIGLYFQPQTPKNRLGALPMRNVQFVLEPGDIGKEADMFFSLDLAAYGVDVPDALVPTFSAIRVGPHMHQLGRRISADLIQPDGTNLPLIEIDNWDFHWQGFYDYVQPVPMPYRSTIKTACVWDNTTDHEVHWGESSEDEMCVVFLGFTAQGLLAPLLFGNPQ